MTLLTFHLFQQQEIKNLENDRADEPAAKQGCRHAGRAKFDFNFKQRRDDAKRRSTQEMPKKRTVDAKTRLTGDTSEKDESMLEKDERLLDRVCALVPDEENAVNNEPEEAKIRTGFLNPNEVKRGPQKRSKIFEKDMRGMSAVKRSIAVAKRAIQTRWVDRQKDGSVRLNHERGRPRLEMFSPTPSSLSLGTMLAVSSLNRHTGPA